MTVVYYPGWGIYGREHFINSINFDDVSEISYAFFDVESDGSLRTIDNYEWAEKAFSAQDSISGVPDTWEDGDARGNQNQLAQLAEQYPDVSINIALGGWTLSDDFSTAVLDQNRDNLINNIVEMARDNPWITGFDMDWEFPGSGGQSGNTIRAEDGENYAKFLEGLNIALDGLSAETGQDYTISVASPPGLTQVDTFGFEYGVAEQADIINLMAYDYHGGWENNTGLQAGIFDDYSNTSSPGIAATIKAMIERGVDIEKVNLGIPLYARGWNIDPETEIANAIGAPSLSAVTGSFEAGIYDAKDILTTIANNPSEWTVVYDTDSMAAFALSETGEFVSIETRSTVALKAAWAKANDFNGLMFWDSSSDLEGTGASLVEAGNDVWEGRQTVADIIATDIIQFDQFIGSGEFYDLLTLDPTGLPISAIQAQENLNEQGAETDLELSNSNNTDGSTVPDEDIQVDMSETTEDSSEIADSINTDHAHDTENQGDLPSSDGASTVNPEVTAQNATHVITWAWGQNIVDSNFNPETDTIFFDWISADAVNITETAQGITISLPANNQSLTLSGIGLSDLKLSNINALDASTQNKLANLITSETTSSGDMSNNNVSNTDGSTVPDEDIQVDMSETTEDSSEIADSINTDHAHDTENQGDLPSSDGASTVNPEVTAQNATHVITWAWGQNIVDSNFNPETDTIFFDWISADAVNITETAQGITISLPANNQSLTLSGIGLSDLKLSNINALDASTQNKLANLITSETTSSGDMSNNNVSNTDGSTVPDEDIQVDMSETTEDSSEIADSINTDHAHDTENQGDLPSSDGASTVNPEVTAQNATHVITWAWGQNIVDSNFNPETDTIFFDWISADAVNITETAQGITISLPANNQSLTLSGIGLSDLKLSNINALDASTQNKLANLITSETTSSGDMSNDHYHDDHNQNDDGYVAGAMTSITLTSSDQIITSFEIATDMVHIEGGITADLLQIFQESGDALGLTTRIVILDSVGNTVSTTIIKDVGLSDLTLANFSIAEQSAQNEIATAIGQTITGAPTNVDGYDIIYDSNDGIPSVTTGTTPEGGAKYRGDINADDVFDFDISRDQIDVGETSVHNLIITKTANGEIAIDSPWTNAMQIFQGVKIADLTMDNFATVGNEHLRQDLGGVMSWELGVGPRDSNTVYVRSHEYGVHEVIDGFDPSAMKISFLFFGTRERLTVEDTDAGLKIWSMPSGQSITFTDITKSDLIPGLIEFHHDQIIEDNLETPFGISASDLTLVDRTVLLTPDAPLGSTTDGFQTQLGNLTGANESTDVPINISSSTLNDDNDGSDAPTSLTGFNTVNFTNSQSDSASLTWEWANKTAITGFDTETDFFDFGNMSADSVNVEEADGNLYFEVLGMGGNITALVGVQAEDLSSENLTAAEWNDVLDADSILIESLVSLGYDFG